MIYMLQEQIQILANRNVALSGDEGRILCHTIARGRNHYATFGGSALQD